MILNKRIEKKYKRRLAIKNWWFRLFKLRKMRKRIRKIYYKEQIKHPEPIEKLPIYAHVFKYDQKQIEYGLDMFVARGELKSYEKVKTGDSKDVYTLIFSTENRSQSRILAEVADEIYLNNAKTEPAPQNQAVESDQAKITSAESVADGPF